MSKSGRYTEVEQILEDSFYNKLHAVKYDKKIMDNAMKKGAKAVEKAMENANKAAMQTRTLALENALKKLKPEEIKDNNNKPSLLMFAARHNAAFAIGPLLDFEKIYMNVQTVNPPS